MTRARRPPPLRVAQCYTGAVGTRVIGLLAQRSDLELVSVLVHDAADRKWIRYVSQPARMVADVLGFAFGRLDLTAKDYAPAPDRLQLPSGLTIEAGVVAAEPGCRSVLDFAAPPGTAWDA